MVPFVKCDWLFNLCWIRTPFKRITWSFWGSWRLKEDLRSSCLASSQRNCQRSWQGSRPLVMQPIKWAKPEVRLDNFGAHFMGCCWDLQYCWLRARDWSSRSFHGWLSRTGTPQWSPLRSNKNTQKKAVKPHKICGFFSFSVARFMGYNIHCLLRLVSPWSGLLLPMKWASTEGPASEGTKGH